jgi:hypothetical protein
LISQHVEKELNMDSILSGRYTLLPEIAKHPLLAEFPLILFDIGCSGGINQAWSQLGKNLRAFAYDCDVRECERLTRENLHPGVHYRGRFVGVAGDHPFNVGRRTAEQKRGTEDVFARTSAAAALSAPTPDGIRRNDYGQLDDRLPPNEPSAVDALTREEGVPHIDVLKIDVDGEDLAVLTSATRTLEDASTCCVLVEVCFEGHADPYSNTFSNIDRFLRERVFYLGALSLWRYSLRDLPAQFKFQALGETVFGAPYLGDAAYFRRPNLSAAGAGDDRGLGATILKLAALYEMFEVPDHSARLLKESRDVLHGLNVDSEALLDLLASGIRPGLTYNAYMDLFRSNT